MSASSATLRAALLTYLAETAKWVCEEEVVDGRWVRQGRMPPLKADPNPVVYELNTLVEIGSKEHPDWCRECDRTDRQCGCGGGFWATDWRSVQREIFDTEVARLGLKHDGGMLVAPSIRFYGPRAPSEELDLLEERMVAAGFRGPEYEAVAAAHRQIAKDYGATF